MSMKGPEIGKYWGSCFGVIRSVTYACMPISVRSKEPSILSSDHTGFGDDVHT